MPVRYTSGDFLLDDDNFRIGSDILDLQAEAPSNIALVKYWGKKTGGIQLPMNASLSFTLSSSKTITQTRLIPLKEPAKKTVFEVRIQGEPRPDFAPKIALFFERIHPYAPYVRYFRWEIDTQNTFPHGSGIASSASGFAALAKLVMQLGDRLGIEYPPKLYRAKTSFLARLGSGSASRSVDTPVMLWGRHPEFSCSTDEYAVRPALELHSVFKNVRDTIVLIDEGVKPVSSSRGHELIMNHPFREQRLHEAELNLGNLAQAMQTGDWKAFGDLLEAEALMLHALMATSKSPYILMQPQTLDLILKLQAWRKEVKVPVYFTLDAGANVHLIYPGAQHADVLTFLRESLPQLYVSGSFIEDEVAGNH